MSVLIQDGNVHEMLRTAQSVTEDPTSTSKQHYRLKWSIVEQTSLSTGKQMQSRCEQLKLEGQGLLNKEKGMQQQRTGHFTGQKDQSRQPGGTQLASQCDTQTEDAAKHRGDTDECV